MADNGELQKITVPKDRERIVSSLKEKRTFPVVGITKDQQQLRMTLKQVVGEKMQLEQDPMPARRLTAGEVVDISFGLADGLYVLKSAVEAVNGEVLVVPLGPELFRLQRRNNFRAYIPMSFEIKFTITELKSDESAKGSSIKLVDISAGGMKVIWPSHGFAMPTVGDKIAGRLVLPNKAGEIELRGRLVSTIALPQALHVGVEFESVNLRTEQSLLFICMQIQRGQPPVLR